MLTLREFYNKVIKEYPKISHREIRSIISHVSGISEIDIFTDSSIVVSGLQKKRLHSFIDRRIDGEPLQYILGIQAFRNFNLYVGPGVLIPRPETEQLVEKALQLLPSKNAEILDIGTGSGAIALSIAQELPTSSVTGVDICKNALKYARKNKRKNNVVNACFKHGNLCDSFSDALFDMIIANLPYVTEKEFTELEESVKKFEPKLALTGGEDGLDLVQKLIPQAIKALKPPGWLLLEIGYTQATKVKTLLQNSSFNNIEVLQDFNNKDRIVIGQKPE